MVHLKLSKLPDRTPVKITVTVSPELHNALPAYANAYRDTYQAQEKIEAQAPAMLEEVLAFDKEFAKARKDAAASSWPVSRA